MVLLYRLAFPLRKNQPSPARELKAIGEEQCGTGLAKRAGSRFCRLENGKGANGDG
jgi:hypothetical protein